MQIHVPRTIEHLEPELKRFVEAMVVKLHMNRRKGKWEGLDLSAILNLLKQEVEELEDAIESGNQVSILLESADCANFALIAAAIAISGINNPPPVPPVPRRVIPEPKPIAPEEDPYVDRFTVPAKDESSVDPAQVELDLDGKQGYR